jgi:small-conductance mechanosensitive channel
MRNLSNDMNNDPSSSRNFEPDSMDELVEEVNELEETAFNLYAEEFRSSSSPSFPPTFEDEEDEEFNNEEFSALNQQLDQLQSALDLLESRNADIHSELLQLLQSNREVRKCITEELASENAGNNPEADATTGTSGEAGTSGSENVKVAQVDVKLENCTLDP